MLLVGGYLGSLFDLGDVHVIGAWAIEPLRFFLIEPLIFILLSV
jgi:hypothetical protein